MDKVTKKFNDVINGKNAFAETLKKFEDQTGLDKIYVLYAFLFMKFLLFAFVIGGDIIILFLAVIYPGIKTAVAIEDKNEGERLRWLKYWVVICCSLSIRIVLETFLFWLPNVLFWVKVLYICWLLCNEQPYSGTHVIYDYIIEPEVRHLLPMWKTTFNKLVKKESVSHAKNSVAKDSGSENQNAVDSNE